MKPVPFLPFDFGRIAFLIIHLFFVCLGLFFNKLDIILVDENIQNKDYTITRSITETTKKNVCIFVLSRVMAWPTQ